VRPGQERNEPEMREAVPKAGAVGTGVDKWPFFL
jgi:hypothetical protein